MTISTSSLPLSQPCRLEEPEAEPMSIADRTAQPYATCDNDLVDAVLVLGPRPRPPPIPRPTETRRLAHREEEAEAALGSRPTPTTERATTYSGPIPWPAASSLPPSASGRCQELGRQFDLQREVGRRLGGCYMNVEVFLKRFGVISASNPYGDRAFVGIREQFETMCPSWVRRGELLAGWFRAPLPF